MQTFECSFIMKTLDTEHWHLAITMQWKPKLPVIKTVDCDYCNGWGTVGGGLGDPEGPVDCPHCHGVGTKGEPVDYPECPEMPPALIARLKKAYSKFCEENAKEKLIEMVPLMK